MTRWIFLTFLLALLAPLSVQAEPAGYAIVDTQQVLEKSKLGAASLATLDSLNLKFKAEAAPIGAEIETLRTQLEKSKSEGAKPEELVEVQSMLEQKTTLLRRKQEDFQREYTKQRNAMVTKLEQKASAAITAVAKESGQSVVLRKENSDVLYRDPAAEPVDLTTLVIQKMDEADG